MRGACRDPARGRGREAALPRPRQLRPLRAARFEALHLGEELLRPVLRRAQHRAETSSPSSISTRSRPRSWRAFAMSSRPVPHMRADHHPGTRSSSARTPTSCGSAAGRRSGASRERPTPSPVASVAVTASSRPRSRPLPGRPWWPTAGRHARSRAATRTPCSSSSCRRASGSSRSSTTRRAISRSTARGSRRLFRETSTIAARHRSAPSDRSAAKARADGDHREGRGSSRPRSAARRELGRPPRERRRYHEPSRAPTAATTTSTGTRAYGASASARRC